MSLVIPSEIIKNTIKSHYPDGYTEDKEPDDSDNESNCDSIIEDSPELRHPRRYRRDQTPAPTVTTTFSKYDMGFLRPSQFARNPTIIGSISPEDVIATGANHDLENPGMMPQGGSRIHHERRVAPAQLSQEQAAEMVYNDNDIQNLCTMWTVIILMCGFILVLILEAAGIAKF